MPGPHEPPGDTPGRDGPTGGESESVFPGFRDIGRGRGQVVAELAASRRALGLTQTEVAQRMGTSQSAVARLEAQSADARLSTLERYAAALGRELQWQVAPPTGEGDPS
jgi:ribosome-binding protein aMBF1 (putative translation factor)